LEGTKLYREEKRLAASFTMSTCTTRAEHQSLRDLGVANKTGWFPNGVDADYFCPDGTDYDSDQICFIGRMDYFPNQQGVTVTGTVPDVRSYVRQSVLSVAPLMIARGTQNKILESMAMGVPVVCSSTAAGGVDAVPGQHLLVAGPEDQYADNIVRLLANTEARRELSMSARQRVLDRHSWPASMSKLDEIVRSVMEPSA
jgi:glycosyltransferase involved in cell wall biosynthesis